MRGREVRARASGHAACGAGYERSREVRARAGGHAACGAGDERSREVRARAGGHAACGAGDERSREVRARAGGHAACGAGDERSREVRRARGGQPHQALRLSGCQPVACGLRLWPVRVAPPRRRRGAASWPLSRGGWECGAVSLAWAPRGPMSRLMRPRGPRAMEPGPRRGCLAALDKSAATDSAAALSCASSLSPRRPAGCRIPVQTIFKTKPKGPRDF